MFMLQAVQYTSSVHWIAMRQVQTCLARVQHNTCILLSEQPQARMQLHGTCRWNAELPRFADRASGYLRLAHCECVAAMLAAQAPACQQQHPCTPLHFRGFDNQYDGPSCLLNIA